MNKWKQKLSVMVPMSDGVRLSCDIRFPEQSGPRPVILLRTLYNKAMNLTDPVVKRWLDQGYIFIAQDARGKHESEGTPLPLLQEINDGRDTVNWIAEQDFCDGNVAMTGASYTGWTQLAAAATNPPALKAVLPEIMCADTFSDRSYTGGVMSTVMIWWMLLNMGRSQQADPIGEWDDFFRQLPLCEMDRILGFDGPNIYREMLSHMDYDDYWDARNVTEQIKQTDVPILLGVGWFDIFAAGAMREAGEILAVRREQGRDDFRVIVGPWAHGLSGTTCGDIDFGPKAGLELKRLQNEFVAHYISGGPLPAELSKPILYFQMGENEWKSADAWPPAAAAPTSLYLASVHGANSLYGDGTLAGAPAGRDADEYTYDPADPTPSIAGTGLFPEQPMGPMDQRPAERRDDVLCYTTEELTQPLSIVGIPVAEIHFESSAPDTDIFVRLCDVHPGGKSMFICDGALRLRYRDGLDHQVLMTPGETYRLDIQLGSTAITLPAGHRLRVEVTSSCFPRYTRNLNSKAHPSQAIEKDINIAKNTLHHSKTKPSKITLPVMES